MEVLEGGFDAYAAYVKGKGDWDLLSSTGGPDLGDNSSTEVDYEKL